MLAIVQARTSSKRFKNKVLFPIYGKPLIEHVIFRIKKSLLIKNIIVATSNNKEDDKLVNFLKKIKIKFYRGDLNNVALRLVMEGLKLQGANPSFLDARDAILLADKQIYNGAHLEEIWTALKLIYN